MDRIFICLLTPLIAGCASVTTMPLQDPIDLQRSLQQAVFYGSLSEIQEVLSSGAKINSPIGCGEFLPLEASIFMNDYERFMFLIDKGAKANPRCIAAARRSDNYKFMETLNSQPHIIIDNNTLSEDLPQAVQGEAPLP